MANALQARPKICNTAGLLLLPRDSLNLSEDPIRI
jgi:hypothetical protein